MERLNYFEPYKSKGAHEEDQLTRAFFVLLKYSLATNYLFYDLIISRLKNAQIDQDIPVFSSLDFSTISLRTQSKGISEAMVGNKLVSVLITNEDVELNTEIKRVDREAVYDGVISLGTDLTVLVENKLETKGVRAKQLCPGAEDVPEEVEIIQWPVVIKWSQIIKSLHSLLEVENLNGPEKLLIEDFLNFVDDHFIYLNPYDKFHYCKGNFRLLNRRIKNILSLIAKDEQNVDYHRNWKAFFIRTSLKPLKMIGLRLNFSEEGWRSLNLSCHFGDTLGQAKAFYKQAKDFAVVEKLKNKGWMYKPNFHIGHIQSNIVWLKTPEGNEQKYFEYWKESLDKLRIYHQAELMELLDQLEGEGVIFIDDKGRQDIQKEIIEPNRNIFSLRPGFSLIYKFSPDEATELDRKNLMEKEIIEKISEALGLIGETPHFLESEQTMDMVED